MLSTTSAYGAPSRTKFAELTSGVGALVLGIGIGALFATALRSTAVALTLTGLALHSFGMWDKRRLEAQAVSAAPAWVRVTYWICWMMLAALILAIARR
jgi:hypothetical protein